jgi:hypothetical protein
MSCSGQTRLECLPFPARAVAFRSVGFMAAMFMGCARVRLKGIVRKPEN